MKWWMTKPAVLLLFGVVLASTVMVLGTGTAQRDRQQAGQDAGDVLLLEHRSDECIDRWLKAHPDEVAKFHGDADAAHVAASGSGSTGCADPTPRMKALNTHSQTMSNMADEAALWTPRIATALLAICAVPWLWGFLLRRLGEVGDALAGRRKDR